MQILIADDHLECRRMMHKALLDLLPDCHVAHAEDGTHAWWELTAPLARFDLLVTDINMPIIGGLELVQRMREHPLLKTTPVIMCTALADRHHVESAAHLQVNGYIAKPFQIGALQQRVRDILSVRPALSSNWASPD